MGKRSRWAMKFFLRCYGEFAIAFAAILPGLLTIRESLWIDELHTSWTCRGTWSEVAGRAAAGNQLPLYSWFMKVWLSTFGESEIAIRMPSLLCWFACIWITARAARRHFEELRERTPLLRLLVIGVIGLWLLFDRIGAFYSIEARPYAVVALCGSILMARVLKTGSDFKEVPGSKGVWFQVDWVWIAAGLCAIHLNPTAGLVVGASWVAKWFHSASDSMRSILRNRLFELSFLVVGTIPIWRFALELSERSGWWSSFAGDASPTKLLALLPVVPWILFPLLVFLAASFGSWVKGFRFATLNTRNRIAAVLLMTSMLPLLGVFALTWTGLAPLAHRRYVLGIYPAVLFSGWYIVNTLPTVRWILLCGALSLAAQIYQQDVWVNWQRGTLFGWQRHEDWKSAIQTIRENYRVGELLIVAPNLIETESVETISASDPNYLFFAVSAMYEVGVPQPQLLLNRQELAEVIASPAPCWFLLRVSPQRCESMLHRLTQGNKNPASWGIEWISFGNLQLIRVVPGLDPLFGPGDGSQGANGSTTR